MKEQQESFEQRKPNVLFLDIETAPNLGYVWGKWEQDVIENERGWYILCFGYKWLGEKTVHVVALPDFPLFKKDKENDVEVMRSLWDILDKADVVIAHNGDRFDIPKINTRLVLHGFKPPSPFKTIDTRKLAKGKFGFDSNKLDDIGQYLNIGRKMHHTGFALWKGCMFGDMKSWDMMKRYNCIVPTHKLLGADLRWREARQFKVGDVILGFDETPINRRYKQATITAMKYQIQPVFRVTLEGGKTFEVTGDHRWLVNSAGHGSTTSYKWVQTTDLRFKPTEGRGKAKPHLIPKLFHIWEEDKTWEAGWLAGIYDGEACLSYRRPTPAGCLSAQISITQAEGNVLDKIITLTNKFGRAAMNNGNYGTGKLVVRTVRLAGTLSEKLKFLGTVRPERLISKVDFNQLGRMEARNQFERVVSVEPIGDKEIVAIATSTGTFIADGYPMHNCQDVKLLERVYEKLRPWSTTHPNMNVFDERIGACPICRSKNIIKRGFDITMTGKKRRYCCKSCGKWSVGRITRTDINIR